MVRIYKINPEQTTQALATTVGAVSQVGQALRDYRNAHGLTQVQLAERLGVARVTVARVESGARRPSQALLAALGALEGQPT